MQKLISVPLAEIVADLRRQLGARLAERGCYEAACVVRDTEVVIRGISFLGTRHSQLIDRLHRVDVSALTIDQMEKMIEISISGTE